MKRRVGFVSNSSSCSFVIIENNIIDYNIDGDFIIGEDGNIEFGWDVKDYCDTPSKINFAILQAMDANKDEWMKMIFDVIKDHTGCDDIIVKITNDFLKPNYGYIDHASSSVEGSNIEMFESADKLKQFLFSDDSYIHTDNDNY